MMDAETSGLTEQMYCSQQINVPLNLPYILKQYAKAAIRTQPADLLYWSAVYFRALADGTTPPVKDRLEYPPLTTPAGLSPGFLRVLIKQFGKKGVIREEEIEEKWVGVGLKHNFLLDLFRLTNNENAKVRWLNFVAVAAGHLCPSLTQTMILICELLTDDPDGGPAAIELEVFLPLYKFLARLNCGPIIKCDATSGNTIDEICDTRPHSFSSVRVDNEAAETAETTSEPAVEKKYSDIEEKYASDAGIPVWEDVRPNVFKRSTSPRPSREGLTSEAGIAVFDHINEDAVTPGYSETPPEPKPVAATKSKEKAKPKPTQTGISKELIREFEGIEIPSQDVGGPDDDLDRIVSAYGEEVKEEGAVLEEDEESDENEENQPPIEDTETSALDEKGGDTPQDQDSDERRISRQLQEQLMEEKRLKDAEKAERKRLKEEARAQKKQLKEQRKAEAAAAKEGKQEEGEKKVRRKKKKVISTESGEDEGETEEIEEVVDDTSGDEIINEEDLDEESSTASSSISIDPDLEAISSSEILGEDEYWEVIEIEEESLDDEEQKVVRKIKKRVKRKLEKKTDRVDKSTSEELKDAKEAVTESGDDEQAMAGSTSVEGLQGKQKEEVRVSGIINLQPDRDDIISLVSEPERFEISFAHVPGIGPTVSETQIKAVVKYMSEWASKQGGYVMPRNIRHFLCPPLDAEYKNEDSLSGASSAKSNKGNKSE